MPLNVYYAPKACIIGPKICVLASPMFFSKGWIGPRANKKKKKQIGNTTIWNKDPLVIECPSSSKPPFNEKFPPTHLGMLHLRANAQYKESTLLRLKSQSDGLKNQAHQNTCLIWVWVRSQSNCIQIIWKDIIMSSCQTHTHAKLKHLYFHTPIFDWFEFISFPNWSPWYGSPIVWTL